MSKHELLKNVIVSGNLLNVTVSEREIFDDLIARTTSVISVKKADIGDIVLIETAGGRDQKKISVGIGKNYYPEYERAALGRKAGEKIYINGEEALIRKVNRVCAPPVSDATVQSLRIEGVETVSDYKNYYISSRNGEIKSRVVRKLFRAVVGQMVKAVRPAVAGDEVEVAFQEKKKEYLDYCGGDEEAYRNKLERDFGKKSRSENETALRERCAEQLKQTAIGRLFAEEDGILSRDNQFYNDYLRKSVEEYFFPKINIQAEANQ